MPRFKRAFLIFAVGVVLCAFAVDAQVARLRPASAVYIDAKGAAITSPEGVAYDGKSLVVVADTGNRRLIKYNLTAETISPIAEFSVSQVPYPVHVRIDSAGRMVVLDGRSRRIAFVGSDGTFQDYLELDPAPGQQAVTVKSFDLDRRDNVFVLDATGERIVVVGADGAESRTIVFPPEVGFISGIAVNASGTVYAVDSVERRVWVARQKDEALTPLAEIPRDEVEFPTDIVADAEGHLFIADEYNGGILVFEQDGTYGGRQSKMGWKEGFLRYPAGLSVANGLLFVADRGNNRIQGFEILK